MECFWGADFLRVVDHTFLCIDLVAILAIWTFTLSLGIDSFHSLILIKRRDEAFIVCYEVNIWKVDFLIYSSFRGEV